MSSDKKSNRSGWVMVFLPETTANWLPTQHPEPRVPTSKWGTVRRVVEAYCGKNLYVTTALAAANYARRKLL